MKFLFICMDNRIEIKKIKVFLMMKFTISLTIFLFQVNSLTWGSHSSLSHHGPSRSILSNTAHSSTISSTLATCRNTNTNTEINKYHIKMYEFIKKSTNETQLACTGVDKLKLEHFCKHVMNGENYTENDDMVYTGIFLTILWTELYVIYVILMHRIVMGSCRTGEYNEIYEFMENWSINDTVEEFSRRFVSIEGCHH